MEPKQSVFTKIAQQFIVIIVVYMFFKCLNVTKHNLNPSATLVNK